MQDLESSWQQTALCSATTWGLNDPPQWHSAVHLHVPRARLHRFWQLQTRCVVSTPAAAPPWSHVRKLWSTSTSNPGFHSTRAAHCLASFINLMQGACELWHNKLGLACAAFIGGVLTGQRVTLLRKHSPGRGGLMAIIKRTAPSIPCGLRVNRPTAMLLCSLMMAGSWPPSGIMTRPVIWQGQGPGTSCASSRSR